MNTDNLILRETDNLPLINKDDTLTNAEIDGNFINIYNDFLSLSQANDPTLIYDVDRSYSVDEFATYNGRLWIATDVSTGVTPIEGSAEWNDVFPTVLAHEKNKDTILDEGGTNETTVAEIRAFIDAGLTSTTNLSLSTKTHTSFKIESSTGTDVTIPQANVREAGLLSAEDKVKLENIDGINTGDQTLISLNAEDVDNKVTDFTTINNTLYPTTQAVDTYITAVVPDLVDTFIGGLVAQDLQDVTTVGNTTTDNIAFTGGVGILLDNTSTLRKGTIDAGYGGAKGIAQICSVGYELKWEAGRLYVMGDGGTTIREVSHNFTTTPSATDDNTKGFIVGSRWILDDGSLYVCTDTTTSTAIWVLKTFEDTTNKAIDFTTVNDTKYPTVKAVDDHINSKLAGLWDDRGSYDASVNLFPSSGGSGGSGAILKGDIWTINVQGTLGGTIMHVGDTVRALVDTPAQTSTNWALLENAIGYVPENVNNKVTTFSGNTTSDTKYPSVKAVVDNFNSSNIKTILGITTLSGSNTGDQVISDATITTTDITTNNFTTSKHGFVPKGTNVGNFLKDDGTWGTPASGSSGGIVGIANSSGVYTYYTTLSLAMTAAVSGQTIELFSDITETGSVTITLKNGVNINGNGHTYTLSVNDGTNAFSGVDIQMEFYNLKVIRNGRANGSSGYALSSSNFSLSIIKCYGTTFINTFGATCVINNCNLYGMNAIGYYDAIVDYGASKIYNAICESNGLGYGINTPAGLIYNSTGRSVTQSGIYCNGEVYESIGISTSGIGIEGQRITNCTGISTSGIALSCTEARNSVGISTSGLGGSGAFYDSTLISSSNYAVTGSGTGGKLYNSYAQSTSSPTTLATNMYNSTVRCLWNNAGGNCTTSFGVSSFEILNSFLEVTNASAYCITGYIGSTWKYSNNSFKGATTAVNSTNITQGITNTSDNQGNILI